MLIRGIAHNAGDGRGMRWGRRVLVSDGVDHGLHAARIRGRATGSDRPAMGTGCRRREWPSGRWCDPRLHRCGSGCRWHWPGRPDQAALSAAQRGDGVTQLDGGPVGAAEADRGGEVQLGEFPAGQDADLVGQGLDVHRVSRRGASGWPARRGQAAPNRPAAWTAAGLGFRLTSGGGEDVPGRRCVRWNAFVVVRRREPGQRCSVIPAGHMLFADGAPSRAYQLGGRTRSPTTIPAQRVGLRMATTE